MRHIVNYYAKDYTYEKELFDDVRSYIELYRSNWSHYRIEINYSNDCLASVHIIMHYSKVKGMIETYKPGVKTGMTPV